MKLSDNQNCIIMSLTIELKKKVFNSIRSWGLVIEFQSDCMLWYLDEPEYVYLKCIFHIFKLHPEVSSSDFVKANSKHLILLSVF